MSLPASRLLCLLLPSGSLFAAEPGTAATPASPAPGYAMTNCVNGLDPAKIEKTVVGYQYWFADATLAEGKTVKLSVVGPGLSTHAPHRHAEDEFFFVLEGTAEFYLGGERRTVGPMTLLYCPPWHDHAIRNIGPTELRYLVMKKYDQQPAPPVVTQQEPGAAQPPAS